MPVRAKAPRIPAVECVLFHPYRSFFVAMVGAASWSQATVAHKDCLPMPIGYIICGSFLLQNQFISHRVVPDHVHRRRYRQASQGGLHRGRVRLGLGARLSDPEVMDASGRLPSGICRCHGSHNVLLVLCRRLHCTARVDLAAPFEKNAPSVSHALAKITRANPSLAKRALG